MQLTNFASGELVIENGSGRLVRLPHDRANRLILFARMHTVEEFTQKLPSLVEDQAIVQGILSLLESAKTSSERWNLKEKFARLTTMVKGYLPKSPGEVVEVVQLISV